MPRVLPNILRAYADYAKHSESAEAYHFWVALATIAGAAQRKIKMSNAYFDVHTNMYILLVSPPGVGKKTTAMRVGKNFLKEVEPKLNFATESGSPEGLIRLLSSIQNPKHQSATVYVSELSTMLNTKPAEMVDFLTDIFDGNPDWSRQTVSHSLQQIKRPWLNFIAGTTDVWLGKRLSEIAVEGGLLARTIIVYSDEIVLKEDGAWPEETAEQRELKPLIVNDLAHIATLEFDFKFTDEALQFYKDWYMDKSRFPENPDYRIASYYARKHVHALKIGMALSLAESDSEYLEKIHLERALILLDDTEKGMKRAFRMVGRNELNTDVERIYKQIQSRNGRGMDIGELLALNINDVTFQELQQVISDLRAMGKIRVEGRTCHPA